MSVATQNRYRKALQSKLAELSAGLQNRGDIAIERVPDSSDEVQLASERELAVHSLDRNSMLIRDVRAALDRIAEGCYGVCLRCDQEIGKRRLDALPWAKYCIKCQEAIDRAEGKFEPVDFVAA